MRSAHCPLGNRLNYAPFTPKLQSYHSDTTGFDMTWYSTKAFFFKKNYALQLRWMKIKSKITIADRFTQMEDSRVERTKRCKLIDIITITICNAQQLSTALLQ